MTLVALLLAVIVSSRVNDPRSAQQLGALVVMPVTAVFIAQLVGQYVLGPSRAHHHRLLPSRVVGAAAVGGGAGLRAGAHPDEVEVSTVIDRSPAVDRE